MACICPLLHLFVGHNRVMEVSSLPPDYFNTKKFFKECDRSLREKGYVVDRLGRPIRKKKLKRTYSAPYIIYMTISVVLGVTLVILLFLVQTGSIRWGEAVLCAPGFTEDSCERMDFLDAYIWRGKRDYDVNGGVCSAGVAFRTWAPKASQVVIQIGNETATNAYKMR